MNKFVLRAIMAEKAGLNHKSKASLRIHNERYDIDKDIRKWRKEHGNVIRTDNVQMPGWLRYEKD